MRRRRRSEVVDPRSRPALLGVGVVLLVLALLGATYGFARALVPDPPEVEIQRVELPELRRFTVERARAELEDRGLVVELTYEQNEDAEPDVVVGQVPRAGAIVEEGAVVTLRVSLGDTLATVPEVLGEDEAAATFVLRANGLVVQVERQPDEEVAPGRVLRTTPLAGTEAPPGTVVTLVVSTGPADRPVPDLVGRSREEAMFELGRAGLRPGRVRVDRGAPVGEGEVASTDPAPGTVVPRDAEVDLVVGGPPPTLVVPPVVGLQQATAEGSLEEVGVRFVVERTTAPGPDQVGRVVEQRPAGGVEVAPTTVVRIVVGA